MSPTPATSPTPTPTPIPTPTHKNTNVSNGLCGDKNIYLCHPGIIVGVIAAIVIGTTTIAYLFLTIKHNKGDWQRDLAWNLRRFRRSIPFLSSRRQPVDKGKAVSDDVRSDVEMAPAGNSGHTMRTRDDITTTKVDRIVEEEVPVAAAKKSPHIHFSRPR